MAVVHPANVEEPVEDDMDGRMESCMEGRIEGRMENRGFTVIELIIAMLITSVLLMITLPAYQQQLIRVRRALARAELQQVMVRQEQFFLDHRRYAESLRDLGYPGDPMVLDEQGNNLVASEQGIYLIELHLLDGVYSASAETHTGQPADLRCGRLGINTLGVKSFFGSGTLSECW